MYLLSRPLLLLLVSFWPMVNNVVNDPESDQWILTRQCTLKVNGSTNINKFSCVIPEYLQPDTLVFYKGTKNEPIKMGGSMSLDVQKFDCKNAMMTNDLRKTLKAKVYPKITIKFLSLSRYPVSSVTEGLVNGAVTIELAGTVKRFDISYSYTMTGDHELHLVGTKQLNFSDFNIEPPRKLGGMIKTNNALLVEFALDLKKVE